MALHTGHRARVKEKFQRDGFDQFADHEVLEALLFYAIPYRDTNPIAHQLIQKAGSFARVFSLSDEEISSISYCGSHTTLFLRLTEEIAKRCIGGETEHEGYSTEEERRALAIKTVECVTDDEIHLLLFDNHYGLIDSQLLFRGSCTSPTFHDRHIVSAALLAHASMVVLISCHGNRIARPDPYEVEATADILRTLELLDIRLLDHYIVGGSTATSVLGVMQTKAQAIRDQNSAPLFRVVSREEDTE